MERLKLIAATAAARAGDAVGAEQIFAQLTASAISETAALARYNLDVLKNGPDHAVLQSADSHCPADPIALDLPSILTLRRMAVAFKGLVLGNEPALNLAWEKNASGMLFKVRIGANRFCILKLVPVSSPLRLPATATYTGFNGPAGSHLLCCENQYLQVYKSGKLSSCGIFYDYRSSE